LSAYADIDNVFSVPTVTINPGDTVTLSVTCGAAGVSVSIDDQTTASTGTKASSTAESCTQAEAGNDAVTKGGGSGILALPAFGTMDFSGVMVNGVAIGSLNPTVANYSEKKNVITTGALTGGGTAFTTTEGS
jgi:predicted Rossmann-fold nucleotide-binding protein